MGSMARSSNDHQISQRLEAESNPKLTLNRSLPDLETLADVLVSRDLSELEYEQDGARIYLSRKRDVAPASASIAGSAPSVVVAPTSVEPVAETLPQSPTDWSQHPGAVRSPMVGVAYVAPEPGAAPFVQVGDEVKTGQTLLIIEAMKVLNPLKAPRDGKVVKIFIRDQEPVEYDEVLIVIE